MTMVVAIDPGTTVGLARWSSTTGHLLGIESGPFHEISEHVRWLAGIEPDLLILCEDARRNVRKRDATSDRRAQGAGSAKRDAKLWDQFLASLGVPYLMRTPAAGLTKWNAAAFRMVWGWPHQTNEHERDAGMMLSGLNAGQVRALLAEARQYQELGRPTRKRRTRRKS